MSVQNIYTKEMSYSRIIGGVSITILICVIIGMIIISVLMSYQMFDNIKQVKTVAQGQPANKNTSYNIPNIYGR